MNTPAGPAAPTAPTTTEGAPFGLPHTLGSDIPDPNAVQPTTPVAPTPEELRFQQQDQQIQALIASNQQMMQMVMSQRPQGPAAPVIQAPAPFTLEGLPDAVAAPKDFVTQLGQRIAQREQQNTAYLTHNITQQISRGAAMDGVFNRFQNQHSELAKRSATLQGAAIAEFQALQQQGIDPVSVAQQNPDSLVARIAQRMQAELGIQPAQLGAPGANQHGAPLTPYSPPTPTQPSAARVAGLQGGSGMPVTPAAPAKPRGFVDQLNDARKASGLI